MVTVGALLYTLTACASEAQADNVSKMVIRQVLLTAIEIVVVSESESSMALGSVIPSSKFEIRRVYFFVFLLW